MENFKTGDKVRCVDMTGDATDVFTVDKVYTIINVFDEYVRLEENPYTWYASRFELVEHHSENESLAAEDRLENRKPILTLKFGSIGVELDPNVPFSRKLAEAFLNIVYEENK